MSDTSYARSDDAHIAYQVRGQGGVDVAMTSYINISIDAFERERHFARFLDRLRRSARTILFDRRGIGLSDPIALDRPPTIESDVRDAMAVFDAAGSTSTVLLSAFTPGPAVLLAALHPERIGALILCNTHACVMRHDDYPHGLARDEAQSNEGRLVPQDRGPDEGSEQQDAFSTLHAPSLGDDVNFRRWWEQEGRRGASPGVAQVLNRRAFEFDVRDVLGSIHVPTLVIFRTHGNRAGHGRYLADHIQNAKAVELEGSDNFPFAEDSDRLIEEIEEFLTGSARHESDRVLRTILFTDIVGSTHEAARVGDREWRDVLDRHDAMVRRQIARFGGHEVKTTGDGFLVLFDGPARCVLCAVAVRDGAAQLGIDVRAGVHAGEVEMRGADVSGIGVHLARRVCDEAGPGDVLVSSTVPALVLGSGLSFADRGTRTLKGVPGTWQLSEVLA